MEAKHTPTPWKLGKARTLIHITGASNPVSSYIGAISLSARHIHEDYAGRKFDFATMQEANAAHIVKCVNAHEEMVDALRDYANLLCSISDKDEQDRIEALITKAEGK